MKNCEVDYKCWLCFFFFSLYLALQHRTSTLTSCLKTFASSFPTSILISKLLLVSRLKTSSHVQGWHHAISCCPPAVIVDVSFIVALVADPECDISHSHYMFQGYIVCITQYIFTVLQKYDGYWTLYYILCEPVNWQAKRGSKSNMQSQWNSYESSSILLQTYSRFLRILVCSLRINE